MKRINSKWFTYLISSIAAVAIVASVIIVLPSIAKAASITVGCRDGSTLTCEGTGCKGADGSGCSCININGSTVTKTCPTGSVLPEVPIEGPDDY